MALVTASRGQQALVPVPIQFTDATGSATNPDAPPLLEVYRSDGTLLTTLSPVQVPSRPGFYLALFDVSDGNTVPAGAYVLLWRATISGTATATVDALQVFESGDYQGTGALAGSYATEPQIRGVSIILENTTFFPAPKVAEFAASGAAYIDGFIGVKYAVPLAAPFPGIIVLLNEWLAASYLLKWKASERGNEHPFADELQARVDAILADIVAGTMILPIPPLPDAGTGRIKSSTIDVPPDFVRTKGPFFRPTDLSRF